MFFSLVQRTDCSTIAWPVVLSPLTAEVLHVSSTVIPYFHSNGFLVVSGSSLTCTEAESKYFCCFVLSGHIHLKKFSQIKRSVSNRVVRCWLSPMTIGLGMGLDQAIAPRSNENMLLLVNANPINKLHQIKCKWFTLEIHFNAWNKHFSFWSCCIAQQFTCFHYLQ